MSERPTKRDFASRPGDAESWITFGGVDRVLDSMISQGKARPMVVVMPFGYGDMAILQDYESHVDRNDALFERVLLGEVMPQVEAAYHVSPRPEGSQGWLFKAVRSTPGGFALRPAAPRVQSEH